MVYLSLSGGSVGERFDNSTFRYDNQSLVCRGRSQLPRQVPLQRSQQTDDTGEILWETMYILCLMPNCFLTAAACACGPSVPTDDEAKEKAMKQFHAIYRELCSEYGQKPLLAGADWS